MNTVLEQLLAQSKLQPYYDEQAGQIEKFAELIVQECAEFARLHNLRHADRSHMIHKAIKEEFGVKE